MTFSNFNSRFLLHLEQALYNLVDPTIRDTVVRDGVVCLFLGSRSSTEKLSLPICVPFAQITNTFAANLWSVTSYSCSDATGLTINLLISDASAVSLQNLVELSAEAQNVTAFLTPVGSGIVVRLSRCTLLIPASLLQLANEMVWILNDVLRSNIASLSMTLDAQLVYTTASRLGVHTGRVESGSLTSTFTEKITVQLKNQCLSGQLVPLQIALEGLLGDQASDGSLSNFTTSVACGMTVRRSLLQATPSSYGTITMSSSGTASGVQALASLVKSVISTLSDTTMLNKMYSATDLSSYLPGVNPDTKAALIDAFNSVGITSIVTSSSSTYSPSDSKPTSALVIGLSVGLALGISALLVGLFFYFIHRRNRIVADNTIRNEKDLASKKQPVPPVINVQPPPMAPTMYMQRPMTPMLYSMFQPEKHA